VGAHEAVSAKDAALADYRAAPISQGLDGSSNKVRHSANPQSRPPDRDPPNVELRSDLLAQRLSDFR
jgi:hypothetical protein